MIHYLQRPNGLRRVFGALRASVVFVIFITTLLLANFIQLLSLLLRPFSKRAFRWVNCRLAGMWWSMSVLMGRTFYGIRGIYSGDEVPMGENAVVFANHQQMPDIFVLLDFAMKKRRVGNLKWIVKYALKYVPGLGWGLQFLDSLFLRRDWSSDHTQIEEAFSKFQNEKIPMWLVSFPEGTRISEEKLERSQQYSRKQHDFPLENVLIPRTKGFVASVTALKGHIEAVYDVTIVYPSGIPSLWEWMAGWTAEYHVHVKRFPVKSMPEGEVLLSTWLIERFREKDLLIKHFYKTGNFPAVTA